MSTNINNFGSVEVQMDKAIKAMKKIYPIKNREEFAKKAIESYLEELRRQKII